MNTPKPANSTHTADYFKSDTNRAVLLRDLVTDNLVTALINMGAELWTHRRRMMVIEQLLTNGAKVTAESIESYVPPPEVAENWEREREAFVANIYEVLARHGDLPVNSDMHWPKEKMKGNIFIDLRNVYEREQMENSGFTYICVGR